MLASLVLTAPANAEDTVPLDAFDGHWLRIADAAEDEARRSSIDTAIEDLSWLVRQMASGVLSKGVVPPGEIAFVWDGEALHQRVHGPNGQIDRPVRVDAGPRQQKDGGGEDTTVEWRRTPDGLEVHWTQSRAFGSNRYRLDANGQTLLVEHRIQVTAIDGIDEIFHTARFAREDLPPVSSSRSAPADAAASQPIDAAPR